LLAIQRNRGTGGNQNQNSFSPIPPLTPFLRVSKVFAAKSKMFRAEC
jgi:hypothetical protein